MQEIDRKWRIILSMNWYKKIKYKIAAQGKRIEWRQEDLQAIEDLLVEGYTMIEIAGAFKINPKVLGFFLSKFKIKDKAQNRRDQWLASLYLLPPEGKGLSIKQIINQYKTHRNEILGALKRLGFEGKVRNAEEASALIPSDSRSRKAKEWFKNNPQWGKEASARQTQRNIEWWKKQGKLKGYLESRPIKQIAIIFLNGLFSRLRKEQGDDSANAVYNKYLQIINNHTYPEDTFIVGTT